MQRIMGKHPGISDAYLKGNIGTSQEIQPHTPPPAPPLVASDPNGQVVAQAEVIGGDPIGLPLTITIRANISALALNAGETLKATVEWGNGGFQPSVAEFDIRQGQIVTVSGSWVRVKVINNANVAINLAAFITIGNGPPSTDPMWTKSLLGLLAGAFVDVPVPSYAKDVQIYSTTPVADAYDIGFMLGGIPLYTYQVLAGAMGTDGRRLPITSAADTIRITNTGAVGIARMVVFFGLQL